MNSAVCLRAHSQPCLLVFASAHSGNAMPGLCLRSWVLDWIIPRLVSPNGNKSAKWYVSGTGHSRYSCSVVPLTSFSFCLQELALPLLVSPCVKLRHLVLLHFESFSWHHTRKWGWTGNADTTPSWFSYSLVCNTSTMDMYISLSKEIIKHPFATCPGHHSCCFFNDCTHP